MNKVSELQPFSIGQHSSDIGSDGKLRREPLPPTQSPANNQFENMPVVPLSGRFVKRRYARRHAASATVETRRIAINGFPGGQINATALIYPAIKLESTAKVF
jgi:hypothetical protein